MNADGKRARVGISQAALEELGEVVHAELPEVGSTIQAEGEIAVLESTKAAVDIYSPVSGTVLAINNEIEKINRDPESSGWLVELEISNPAELEELYDPEGYTTLLSG